MSELFDEFGALRSLMNLPHLDDSQRGRLWASVRAYAQAQHQRYRSTRLPYLRGFPHHYEQPWASLTSLEQLAQALELVPFARFDLDLASDGIGAQQARALAESLT